MVLQEYKWMSVSTPRAPLHRSCRLRSQSALSGFPLVVARVHYRRSYPYTKTFKYLQHFGGLLWFTAFQMCLVTSIYERKKTSNIHWRHLMMIYDYFDQLRRLSLFSLKALNYKPIRLLLEITLVGLMYCFATLKGYQESKSSLKH